MTTLLEEIVITATERVPKGDKSEKTKKAPRPCVFASFGLCKNGDECKFDHSVKPDLTELNSHTLFTIASARKKVEDESVKAAMQVLEDAGLSEAGKVLIRSHAAGAIRRRGGDGHGRKTKNP